MDLEMVLNELSLRPLAKDVQGARQRMGDLVSTIAAATKLGVGRVLRTDGDFNSEEIAPGYPVAKWRNDHEVDRETRSFFRSLTSKAPYLTDIVNPELEDRVNLTDFIYEDDKALGLGIAFMLNALALSIRSDSRWYLSHIELKFMQIDDDGEIFDENVEVIHASHRDHVLEHANWIKDRINTNVSNGTELWKHKEELFPNLQFCETVGEQMQALLLGNPMLRPIMKRLNEFETFCNNWYDGPFDPQKVTGKVTLESQVTLERFAQERTFRCPDGQQRIFSWHARVTPGAWRVYFYPLEDKRELIIGYIGSHLHTVSDPT